MLTLLKLCARNPIPAVLTVKPPCQTSELSALQFSQTSDCCLRKCELSVLNHLWLLRNYFALKLLRSCSRVVSHNLTNCLITTTPKTSTGFCFIRARVEFSSNILLSFYVLFSIITVRPDGKNDPSLISTALSGSWWLKYRLMIYQDFSLDTHARLTTIQL